ncbi:PIR protein [Plasmodium ovale]|uniref:PIR protein n=1 Tax=Plasmodium ovale TaxID=36330 RepID=A0A1D3JF17_PLAOA|nr:PIR protein [Plasmodium ovale]
MAQPETILKGLPKYELYKKLDNKDDSSHYDSYCTRVGNLESRYNGIRELCSMFARNLIKLNEILKDEDDKNDRCKYFTFWIHDYLRKNFSTQWKDLEVNVIIRKFFSLLNTVKSESGIDNCNYDYVNTYTLDLFKNWKDLYDFIKNYNEIHNKINSNEILCSNYLEYYKYIEGIYNSYKQECCNIHNNKCPFPYGYNSWCQQTHILPKLECNEANRDESASTMDVRTGTLEKSAQDVSHSAATSLLEYDQDTTGDIMTKNSDYYAKIGVSLPFLGILSTSFYLYKFTTFGTWIKSKLLRKSKINFNPNYDTEHLLPHGSKDTDLNTHNDDFNINYQLS